MLTPCYTSGYADTSQYIMLGDWCCAVTGTILLPPPNKSSHRYREGHRGENIFNDSEICAEPLTVNILNDKFNIAFKPANNNAIDATQASKGTVTVKTGDSEAVDVTSTLIHSQEDGTDTLKAVKMGSEVKVTAKPGYKFKTIEVKTATAEDGVYYDMLGRRTTKPIKGQLYFVKGMKVIF